MNTAGNEYRTTLVCIDQYHDGILQGRLQNLAMTCEFHSLMEFFQAMETLLNQLHFPQPFLTPRTFGTSPAQMPPSASDDGRGKLATFALVVLYRQNATWQGNVTWLEGSRKESFRSALELALLIDGALRTCTGSEKSTASAKC